MPEAGTRHSYYNALDKSQAYTIRLRFVRVKEVPHAEKMRSEESELGGKYRITDWKLQRLMHDQFLG